MKILHAITSLRKSAGTTTFVNGISDALADRGITVVIALTSTDGEFVGERPYAAIPITTINEVIQRGEHFDVVHAHGLWEIPLLRLVRWAYAKKMPVLWSPHGALAPWAMKHHWWKKALVWHLVQKPLLRKAALFHSTSRKESGWIKSLGFKQRIVEAPLGTSIVGGCSNTERKVVLFVGRIYPVKGLERLIRAWKIVVSSEGVPTDWKLRIVGPDQAGHRSELERVVCELGLNDSVVFAGPEFGEVLNREYDECACLVLPSFTENFGGVVVEAMSHGKPCVASTFTPWQELTGFGCGWWVDNQPETLAKAILEMINAGVDERKKMGAKGRSLVEEKYTWNAVASAMVAAYESIGGIRNA